MSTFAITSTEPSILSQITPDEWLDFFQYCHLAEQGVVEYYLPDEQPASLYTFPKGVPGSSLEEALKIVQEVSARYTDEALSRL
jgi:hypothetical protein